MKEPAENGRRTPESPLRDMVDGAVRRIVTGIVIAGAFVGLALYSRPGPPRYQAFATEDGIVRVDTRRGTVIACQDQRCYTVVRRGQRLEKAPLPEALPAPPPRRALPAPAAEPAPAAPRP